RAVDALLPGLKTQLTNELRQNGAGSNGDQPSSIHTWLERFGKQKPRSFSSATSLVDAENWIAHIEKLFEVLGYANEFKARLASYKFEGDALNWWKAFKQAKGGEEYVAILSWKDFREIFFLQYFPMSEQQKYEREYHTIRQKDGELTGDFMKRFLSDWILDGIVNTEFTDVAQVANAGRNIELLHERSGVNNKRNRDGDRIQSTSRNNNQRENDQKRQGGNDNQRSWRDRDQQYNRSTGSLSQRKYTDYASAPCNACGKHHPGKECYRATGACFTCGSTGHMARDCPRNSRNDGDDKRAVTKGRTFDSTANRVSNTSGTILGNLL
ncbi:retrotransposon protein, putative, ty3-gypsy subclass, partial [Tanacetum coccineum]